MYQLYDGMVNSPETELAQNITSTQTTIPVKDASKLPAPPNLAVIGRNADAETILYTGKSGNTLTGVTRGFQGTAKSWKAGAPVARRFTEYDWRAIKENFEKHAVNPVANVKGFGAKGDGVTDESAALQAAIDSLQATGGVIHLPPGTYLISRSIKLRSNTVIRGSGIGATVLKLANNAAGGLDDPPNGRLWIYGDGVSNVTVENLTVDGNGSNQTHTFRALTFKNSNGITVSNVDFTNVHGRALSFLVSSNFHIDNIRCINATGAVGNPGGGIYIWRSQRGVISNVFGMDLDASMLYTDGDSTTPTADIMCVNMVTIKAGRSEVAAGPAYNIAGNSQRINLSNCHAFMCAIGFRIYEQHNLVPVDITLSNCTSNITDRSTDGHGFVVASLQTSPVSVRIQMSNCRAYRSGNYNPDSVSYGFNFQNVADLTLNGLEAIENNDDGVYFLNCRRVQWTGGRCINNGRRYSSPSRNGVRLGDGNPSNGCSDIYISDVVTTDTNATGKLQHYGFYVRSGCTNVVIAGGKHEGNATGAWAKDPDVDASCVFLGFAKDGSYRSQHWGTSAPTSGTWCQGDIVWNLNPTAGANIGWVCVSGGTPGTWKTFGTIST